MDPADAFFTTNTFFTVASFLVIVVVMLRMRERRKNCLSSDSSESKQNYAPSDFSQLENNTIKLYEVLRELEARVQNKSQVLEHLIKDADERIKTLNELSEQNSTSTTLHHS